MAKWLKDNREGDFSEVKKAMIDTYEQMMGKQDSFRYDSRVDIGESDEIYFSCPGDACGIGCSSHNWRDDVGYEFSPHNTDTAMQQLTLLAGLTALHDKARGKMVLFLPAA